MTQDEKLKEMLSRYLEGKTTPEETALLELRYLELNRDKQLQYSEENLDEAGRLMWADISTRTNARRTVQPIRRRLWPRVAAAAILLVLGAGLFYFNTRQQTTLPGSLAESANILPGKQGATLIMANGRKIRLAEAAVGKLAQEGGVTITKTSDGQLRYHPLYANGNDEGTNTLATEKGETYQVNLPDGSLVYLNAASTLSYSTRLLQNGQRRIRLSGEAYFEVAKDAEHPFIVESPGQKIQVLGTHFNISAYPDEPVSKTNLLEGSVSVNDKAILRPGEQATVNASGNIDVTEKDVEEAIAWKNGKFVFDYENLESVMRKLSRWYDVEVVYQTSVSEETFSGKVSRFDDIRKILDMITYTNNIHFKIEGRRIMVIE